ncbi:hypothetical protein IGI66_000859 [Enterococcus sp. AZ048]|uniref:hypothetical protein n=1 Tax=Enterococcus sp. AZ048 TaxID=2774658 RepID=UPI003F228050
MDYEEREINKYQERIPNVLKNSWWKEELNGWHVNAGSVSIEEDEDGCGSLIVDSSVSSQICQSITLKPNHQYFVRFEVRVTRYVKGLFGVYFRGNFQYGNPNMGLKRVTKGFETVTNVLHTSEDLQEKQLVFAGSIHGADGAGSIRRLTVIDLTELYGRGKEPNSKTFEEVLPDRQDEEGLYLSMKETFSLLDGKLNKNLAFIEVPDKVPDEVALTVFLEEMNNKAKLLGMKNTTLKNINGFRQRGHLSTSRDILKLVLNAIGYKEILSIWGKKEHKATIRGKNTREINVMATVQDENFEKSYTILGGKSGTILNRVFNSVALVKDKEGELYLASVMGASGDTGKTDCYEAMKVLVDTAKKKKSDPDYAPLETYKAKSGSVIVLPRGNPHFYTLCPPESLYEINENQKIPPASMTKMINALIVLDNVHNLNETFQIKAFDISGGSGPRLYEGDVISFWDALHFLFLPSSNTIAKAFSRIVGEKIIQARGGYLE